MGMGAESRVMLSISASVAVGSHTIQRRTRSGSGVMARDGQAGGGRGSARGMPVGEPVLKSPLLRWDGMASDARMNGPARGVCTTPADHFTTRLLRSRAMPNQGTSATVVCKSLFTHPTCEHPSKKASTAYRMGCRCRRCKDANNVWQKGYHRRRPGKALEYLRRRKFGLEPSDIEAMLREQGGRCAICRIEEENLGVDHCHDTGIIRGLLCNNCNTAIGLLKHERRRCESAIEYLARHSNGQ